MSLHASGALIVFAMLQVAGVVAFAGLPGGALLPFLALLLLVVAAIPHARRMERRWSRLSDTALPSQALIARFRRDRAALWRLALLAPALWLGLFAGIAQAAA